MPHKTSHKRSVVLKSVIYAVKSLKKDKLYYKFCHFAQLSCDYFVHKYITKNLHLLSWFVIIWVRVVLYRDFYTLMQCLCSFYFQKENLIMTRNIRKIVSIICAVALLLSLCAVSFIGSSSAFHLDAVEKDDSYISPNGTTVLDLTFEGTNNGGAAMSTTHTGGTYIENGALYTGNGATAAGTVWIGKDGTVNNGTGKIDITGKTNCTTANTLSANLFELKPDTTYKITYKYAFRNDSQESRRLEFMCAIDPYLSSGHGRADSLSTAVSFWTQNVPAAVTETSIPGDKGYGEWKEDSIVFTTKSTLTNKYLGVRTPYSTVGGTYVKFDYIKVETFDMVVDNTQVYDWTTDGATPAYWNPNNNNFLSDSNATDDDYTKGSFVNADGLHFSFAHTSSPDYNKGWIKEGIVQKNNGSSSLTFESGKN
jgi:hypothetical protein